MSVVTVLIAKIDIGFSSMSDLLWDSETFSFLVLVRGGSGVWPVKFWFWLEFFVLRSNPGAAVFDRLELQGHEFAMAGG